MNWLELKLPPPAVALVVALLMWLAAALLPPLPIAFGIRLALALVAKFKSALFGGR